MDNCYSAEVKEDGWDNSRLLARARENAIPATRYFTDLGTDDKPH